MGKKLILFFVAAVSGVILFGARANAATFLGEDTPTVAQDQTIDGALFVAGNKITIAGSVKGDLFCGAQTVEITGTIDGDVICGAETINITGVVTGDIRVAAQTFTLASSVDKSVTIFAGTANFEKEAFIGVDAAVYAQTLNQNGFISRDLLMAGGTLNIAGTVAREVQATVNSLSIGSTAIVGDVAYTSDSDANVANGASVASIERSEPTTNQNVTNPTVAILGNLAYWFIAMLLIGVAMMISKPQVLQGAGEYIKSNVWASLGWGALFVFAAPLAALVLALTIVGIPLGIVIFLAWIIVLIVAQTITSYVVGSWILSKTKVNGGEMWTRLGALALGLLIVGVLMIIPFIGWLLGFVATVIGAGSLKYMSAKPKKVKV